MSNTLRFGLAAKVKRELSPMNAHLQLQSPDLVLSLWRMDPDPVAQRRYALRVGNADAVAKLLAEISDGHQAVITALVERHNQDNTSRLLTSTAAAMEDWVVSEGLEPALALWRPEEHSLSVWPDDDDWSRLELGKASSRRFVRKSSSEKPMFRQAGRRTAGLDGRYLALAVLAVQSALQLLHVELVDIFVVFFDAIHLLLAKIEELQQTIIQRTGNHRADQDEHPVLKVGKGEVLPLVRKSEHVRAPRADKGHSEVAEAVQRFIGVLMEPDMEASIDRATIQSHYLLLLLGSLAVDLLAGVRTSRFSEDADLQERILGEDLILPAQNAGLRKIEMKILSLSHRCFAEDEPREIRDVLWGLLSELLKKMQRDSKLRQFSEAIALVRTLWREKLLPGEVAD